MNTFTDLMKRSLPLAALMITSGAMGQATELFVVDFEEFPEETEISDQYAALGITFEIEGDPTLFPIIAVEGAPVRAFTGGGNDKPMTSGLGGLTDPLIGNSYNDPSDIRMRFDPPVTSVRLFYIDLDNDPVTVTAYDENDVVIQSTTISPGDPGAGNGKSTEFALTGGEIASVLVDAPSGNNVGYAIDYVNFTRVCEDKCGKSITIAQESAPGVGDFDANILGQVIAYPTAMGPAQFYGYNVPEGDSWNGGTLTPVADRSHLLLADTTAGLSLFIVHDQAIPNDPDGGDAEMVFDLQDDDDGAYITVKDDPDGDAAGYFGEPGTSLFRARWSWNQCCTDGLALSDLDDGSTLIVSFNDFDNNGNTQTINGLLEWVAYSADGSQIPLALEEDRRVRLQIPGGPCPGDLDGDGTVGISDILLILSFWGNCPG